MEEFPHWHFLVLIIYTNMCIYIYTYLFCAIWLQWIRVLIDWCLVRFFHFLERRLAFGLSQEEWPNTLTRHSYYILHPWKLTWNAKHEGLVQMIWTFQTSWIFQVPGLRSNFQGVPLLGFQYRKRGAEMRRRGPFAMVAWITLNWRPRENDKTEQLGPEKWYPVCPAFEKETPLHEIHFWVPAVRFREYNSVVVLVPVVWHAIICCTLGIRILKHSH